MLKGPLPGVIAQSQNENASLSNGDNIASVQDKYNQERDKRLRADGTAQFADIFSQDKFKRFQADLWVEQEANSPLQLPQYPKDGERSEILIAGTGYGGLLYAVRLLQEGFKLEDLRMVDSAAGFGGTWYWNRYPGLMCDVESYIYMPLLEETGYIPTMKYTSSQELREHAERIAKHYELDKITWFRQRVQDFVWDENNKEWITTLVPQLKQGKEGSPLKVRSRFAIMATGVVTMPQVPLIPGIDKFKGPMFHTARWDYNITGGSDKKPALTKLQDKRVAIVGTGASAIQVVPAVSPWAKELLVFQRTPSAVDVRGNQPTDMNMAKKMFSQPGWQQKRSLNWHKFVLDYPEKPEVNMVDDGWTRFSSFSALGGGPKSEYGSSEDMQKLVERLNVLDYPRQEAIRKRIDSVVKDPETADRLKPWYPGWCKRACFHDEYLQSFNEPNVKLVDTNGSGVRKITEDGLFVGDREYKVDVLILSTGYKSPVLYSPPGRVGVEVKGRHGISLNKKWTNGTTTLHGMMSHDFPNLFWPGLNQAGSSPNFIFTIDGSAKHTAKILAHAAKTSGAVESESQTSRDYRLNFTVEPSAEAEEAWSQVIVSGAGAFAATASCTPSYFNAEGEFMREAPAEVQLQRARGAVWPRGALDFFERIEEWREKAKFEGVEISAV